VIRRVAIFVVCIVVLFIQGSFAQDRDVSSRDLKGIPKSHRYFWAVVGGTAVGAGLGIIAPGGSQSAVKGALIGGSATSAFYLAKRPRAVAEGRRDLAHIVTNAALGAGILWTACDCDEGAWAGAFLGGGGTAVYRALKPRSSRSIADLNIDDTQPSASYQPGVISQAGTSSKTQDPQSGTSDVEKTENDGTRTEAKKPPPDLR